MRVVWTQRLSLTLGVVYAALSLVQPYVHRDDGLAIWFLTLASAATLVLVGTLRPTRNPDVGDAMVTLGAAIGMLPTMRSVVVPLLAVTVITLTMAGAGQRYGRPA
jgi:VanZ family protein